MAISKYQTIQNVTYASNHLEYYSIRPPANKAKRPPVSITVVIAFRQEKSCQDRQKWHTQKKAFKKFCPFFDHATLEFYDAQCAKEPTAIIKSVLRSYNGSGANKLMCSVFFNNFLFIGDHLCSRGTKTWIRD